MSSTAAVAPGVSYHLPKQRDAHNQSSSSDHISRDSDGTLNNVKAFPSHKLVVSNIDSALRCSFKPFLNPSTRDTNNDVIGLLPATSVQKPLLFHESTAPTLDSIVRRKIETFPTALILTNDGCTEDTTNGTLCADTDLLKWCRMGSECVPHRALGLNNSGNTCYLNSVLQCLLATGPLLAYLKVHHNSQSSCPLSTQNGGVGATKLRFCALCGLHHLLSQHYQRDHVNGFNQLTPSYFVTNVRAICPSLRPYQQEDAHEFLLGVLSRMEDCLTAGYKKVPRNLSENNVIRRIFGGLIRSEVTCNFCRKVSTRDDPCFNLSLDITCSRSLQQCLYNYIRSEQLCGQNAYKCEHCRQLRPAVRRSTIFRCPPILVIQFNRFSRCQKLDTRVEYPSSFNIRPFMSEASGPPVLYRLFATVNHEGHSCRSGHYVAFSRRHAVWVLHNDSFVSSTSPESVLRQTPYLLFYEAVDPSLATGIEMTKVANPSPVSSTNNYQSSLSVNNVPLQKSPGLDAARKQADSTLPLAAAAPTVRPENGTSKSPGLASIATPTSATPRVVFNPNMSVQRLSLTATASATSLLKPSSTKPLHSSNTLNNPTHELAASLKSPVPRVPTLSTTTVRHLLYGQNTTPDLWTEKPTPSVVGDAAGDSCYQRILQHKTVGPPTYVSSPVRNHAPKRQHSDHYRQHVSAPLPQDSTSLSNGIAPVKPSTCGPTASPIKYGQKSNGFETSPSSINRGRITNTTSDSDSSESGSIVWLPVTRKDLDGADNDRCSHKKHKKRNSTATEPTATEGTSKDRKRRRREKRERDRLRKKKKKHRLKSEASWDRPDSGHHSVVDQRLAYSHHHRDFRNRRDVESDRYRDQGRHRHHSHERHHHHLYATGYRR